MLVEEAIYNGARQKKACEVLGLSARTLERWRVDYGGDQRQGPVTSPANKLSEKDKLAIIQVCNSSEYKDMPPTQIVPRLADKGEYLASEASFYRVLKENKLLSHRTDTKPKKNHKPSEHIATGPNQVWSWDVTYLKTHVKGMFLYLYLILDVYSRKVVGWNIHNEDNAENASVLASITCLMEGIDSAGLVLHSDNGKSQKGATMLGTLQTLGIKTSFSRPSVSNDNPYSEAFFKTYKYMPSYPETGFKDIEEAKTWTEKFVSWYNNDHLHSGIKFVTPNERHQGLDKVILENRKSIYEEAKKRNPNRWSGKTRNWNHVGVTLLNPLPETREQVKLGEVF